MGRQSKPTKTLDIRESLRLLKELALQDLTGLGSAWLTLPALHANLLVDCLLLETARPGVSYSRMLSADLGHMQLVMNLPTVQNFKAAMEAVRKAHQKISIRDNIRKPSQDLMEVVLALSTGHRVLSTGFTITKPTLTKTIGFTSGVVHDKARSLLSGRLGPEAVMFADRYEKLSKSPLRVDWKDQSNTFKYSVKQFENFCKQVFTEGNRVDSVQMRPGVLFAEQRESVRTILAEHWSSDPDWVILPLHLTTTQRKVYDWFFQPVPATTYPPLVQALKPGQKKATAKEIEVVANEIVEAFRWWSTRKDIIGSRKRLLVIPHRSTPHPAASRALCYLSFEEAGEMMGLKGRIHSTGTPQELADPIRRVCLRSKMWKEIVGKGGIPDFPARAHLREMFNLYQNNKSFRMASRRPLYQSISRTYSLVGSQSDPRKVSVCRPRGRGAPLIQRIDNRLLVPSINTLTSTEMAQAQSVLSDLDMIVLHYYTDKAANQKDIAALLGITQGAVSHRIRAALERFANWKSLDFRVPTERELRNFLKDVVINVKHVPHSSVPRKMTQLLALIKCKGCQSEAAKLLGNCQGSLSNALGRIVKIWFPAMGPEVLDRHKQTVTFFQVISSSPYALVGLKDHGSFSTQWSTIATKLLSEKAA